MRRVHNRRNLTDNISYNASKTQKPFSIGNGVYKFDKTLGDGYSPLNDASRLTKRNDYVRYFGDRFRLIFMRQLICAFANKYEKDDKGQMQKDFDSLWKNFNTDPRNTDYTAFIQTYLQQNEEMVKEAYHMITYKEMSPIWKMFRFLWMICTIGGTIPKAWSVISSSSYTVAITVVTSYMVQSQNEGLNLVNGRESWVDATSFVYNVFQMGILVLGMLAAVQIINYLEYAWKSHRRNFYEARFKYILSRYQEQNPTMSDYSLEYNTACDPDIAIMYFTLREEDNDGTQSSILARIKQLCFFQVNENLIWERVVHPEIFPS
jgi:hypothetical protein